MSKFLDYVEHVQVIDEAISPENYRDNQIGKIDADGKAVLVKDFLDKIIYFFQSFPFDGEMRSVGPQGEDPNTFYNWPKTSVIDNNYQDYFVKKGEKLKADKKIFKQSTSKLEHNAFSEDSIFNNLDILDSLLSIKNKHVNTTQLRKLFGSTSDLPNLLKKINDNTLTSEDEKKLNYCIYTHVLKNNNSYNNFVETRGANKNIWLISPIKDAIYNTNLRDLLKKKSKIKENIVNKIENDINKKSEEIKKIYNNQQVSEKEKKKKTEELKQKITELESEIEELKNSDSTNLISVKDSIGHTINLFKSIKRQMNDKATNEFDKVISWRKLIFDYNNLTSTGLSNEVLRDRKYVINFLVDLDFKVNELEFDLGYVTPPEDYTYPTGVDVGTPISLTDLSVYLKVKSNEIKPKDETKLNKTLTELNLKKGVNFQTFADLKFLINETLTGNRLNEMKERDVIDTFNDQNLTGKDNKFLLDWASLNKKNKEMQTVIKRYDRNKYTQLLTLIKTFMNKSKEEYQKAINIINNPRVMGANNKLKIIFTLSPRNFLSQSTRANLRNGITSCMNIFFGCNRHYIPTSLSSGAFTAYLVKINKDNSMTGNDLIDSKIIDPIARVVIKPFKKNNTDEIYWYADRPYVDRASKIGENDFRTKVNTILDRYHNSFLSEGKYAMEREHYADSTTTFNLDKLFKIINNEQLFTEFKNKLKLKDEEAIKDFKNILITKEDGIFDIWGEEQFPSTPDMDVSVKRDIRKLPSGIDVNNMTIETGTLARLPDDTKFKKLFLREKSNVTSLSNLKNLENIKEILIDNNQTALADNILTAKSIERLTLKNNNISSSVKEINLPTANITIRNRNKVVPKNIICNTLEIISNDLTFLKNTKIKCNSFLVTYAGKIVSDENFEAIKDLIENNLETNRIEFNVNASISFYEIDLSKIKKSIKVNSNNIKVIFPDSVDNLTLINYENGIPNLDSFWEKVYTYQFENCQMLINPSVFKCKKILTDIFSKKFDYTNFYYLDEKMRIKVFKNYEEIQELSKKNNFYIEIIEQAVLNSKTKKNEIEKIINGILVLNSLVIDLQETDKTFLMLKDKKINVSNRAKINISIRDKIKYNFSIIFYDEPDTINKNITINVDKDVNMINLNGLFVSDKSLISIFKEVPQSDYDDVDLKVISKTPYKIITKNFGNKIVPINLSKIDTNNKLNVVDKLSYNIKFGIKDIKKSFNLFDYFNFTKENRKEIKINVHIYEIYHEMFKNLKLDYKKLLELSKTNVTEMEKEAEAIKAKIDTMVSNIDFSITGMEEAKTEYQTIIMLDFFNIFFNDKKFCDQNKISLTDMPEIKKEIIQKYKLNAHLITKLYEKLITKTNQQFIENVDKRPKIVAAKQGDSYLPEES